MIILIIDDNALTRTIQTKLIKKLYPSFNIDTCSSYEEAITKDLNYYDLVITDNILSKKTGSDLVNYIRRKNINTKIVILTGWHFLDDEIKKLDVQIYHKPINLNTIKNLITENTLP